MSTFLELLGKANNVEDLRISPLPAGEYELRIKSINPAATLNYDFGDTPQGTKYVEIYLTPVRPLDVDEDDLAQCPDWSEKLLSIRLISAGDMTKLADIANKRGLVYDSGLDMMDYVGHESYDPLWKELTGKLVGGQIIHRENKKTGAPVADLKRTFPLE